MIPRIYLGAHCNPSSWPIVLATQLALDGPWVIDPRYPATHMFIVLQHADGLAWRLDGEPPTARWRPCGAFRLPTVVWEVRGNVAAGVAKARSLDGIPYDLGEIGMEAARVVASLPWRKRLVPGVRDMVATAMICSRVALAVVREVGVVIPVDSLIPEHVTGRATRLARSAVQVGSPGLSSVVPGMVGSSPTSGTNNNNPYKELL